MATDQEEIARKVKERYGGAVLSQSCISKYRNANTLEKANRDFESEGAHVGSDFEIHVLSKALRVRVDVYFSTYLSARFDESGPETWALVRLSFHRYDTLRMRGINQLLGTE